MNLLLAPEYGGRIHHHADQKTVPEKVHLKICFTDNTTLTVRLTGRGSSTQLTIKNWNESMYTDAIS